MRPWPGTAERCQLDDRVELVERLDGQRADAGTQRCHQLGVGLAGAGEHDPVGREARSQDGPELTARGHVGAQPRCSPAPRARPAMDWP